MTQYTFSDDAPLSQYFVKQALVDSVLHSRYPITWIWGDTGMGKSVFASMVFEQIRGQKLWLDITEDNADVARFLRRLIQGVVQIKPDCKDGLQSISFLNQANAHQLYKDLGEKLFGQLDQHLTLFLDDTQPIQAILPEFIRSLVEQRNHFLRICVISPTAPDERYLSVIANNQVLEISPSLLRFTVNETADFLKGHDQLINEDVLKIHNKSQGKAAVIAAYLSGETIPLATEVSHQADGCLSAFNDEEISILTELTLYNKITPALLQERYPSYDIETRLTNLSKDTPFVDIKIIDDETCFVLNPDVMDALEQLHKPFSETQIREAAAWEASIGNTEAAFSLYEQIGDLKAYAGLLLSQIPAWYQRGKNQDILHHLALVPDDEKKRLPWLWIWESATTLPIDLAEAKRTAELAFACFKKTDDKRGMYVAIAHVILTYLVRLSDFVEIKPWLQEAAEFDADDAFDLIDDLNMKATVSYAIWFGMFMVMPNHQSLPRWEKRIVSLLLDKSDDQFKLKILLLQQKAYLYLGDNYRIHPLETVVKVGNDKPLKPYDKLNYNLVKIHESWCQGGFAHVSNLYSNSKEIAAAHHMQALLPHTSLQVIVSLLLDNEYDKAKQEIYSLLEQVPRHQTISLHHLYSMETWRQVLEKDFAQAVNTSQLCQKISTHAGSFAYQGFALMAEIYALSLVGDHDQAKEKLIELELYRDINFYTILSFHTALINCYLEFMKGNKSSATEHALRAFEFGAQKRLYHFIWAVPEVLSIAASLVLETVQHTEYCMALIQHRQLTPPDHALSEKSWCWPVTIKTLGVFQSNIEALIKPGKSRRIQLLILYLTITYAERGVPLELLYDTLWPDEDISSARHKLDNALYRLRQLLGKDSLNIINNNVQLNREMVWVDVFYLMNLMQKATKLIQAGSHSDELKHMLIEMGHLYQGEFLQDAQESAYQISNFRVFIDNKISDLMEKALVHFNRDEDRATYDFIVDRFIENSGSPTDEGLHYP